MNAGVAGRLVKAGEGGLRDGLGLGGCEGMAADEAEDDGAEQDVMGDFHVDVGA
ncbi:hypothetical protein [Nonomuraea dietziae]|uniref:hypothetical protein n=1 Tax=Nonomuraea dietziae TaxID=65515 RepID=UPI00344005C3